MAIFDALGQYASNRFSNAIDQFGNRMNQVGQILTDPRAALEQRMAEEEEERKRREREQQLMAEMEQRQRDMQAANTAVKQTIVTQPDGTQEMTIKGTPQALSGMNPNTPTVSGPAIPNVMGQQATQDQQAAAAMEEERRLREQEAAQQRQQQQAQAAAAPVAAVASEPLSQDEILREQEQRRQYQQMMARPPEAQAAPAPAAQPVSPQQQMAGQGPQPVVRFGQPIPQPPAETRAEPVQMAQAATGTRTDVTAPTTGTMPAAAPAAAAPAATKDYSQTFRNIETNETELARVVATSQDPAERKIAGDLLKSYYTGLAKANEARDIVNRAYEQNDPQAQTQMQRELKKKDGSYVKAYLYARLGLTQLAEEEQAKLGEGRKRIEQVVLNGKSFTAEVDSRGQILRAYDDQGDRTDNKTIAQLQASGQRLPERPQTATATRVRDSEGKEWSQVPTAQGMIFFDNENRRGTPKGQTTPISVSGDIPLQRKLADMRVAESIIKRGVTNLQDAKAEYIKRVGPFGTAQNSLTEQEFDQIHSGQLSAVNMAPSVTGTGTATGATVGPIPPAAAPAAGGPAAGGRAAGGPVRPTVQGRAGGGRFETAPQTEVKTAAAQAEAKPPAEERGKIEAKGIRNQAYADSSYGLIKSINDEIKRSTGSGIGAGVDVVAGLFGKGTEGAQAIARLEILSGPILANVPRFEGPQSDRDVAEYKRQAGDFANAKKPIAVRLAALDAMITILKKYDKEGRNDWTFGGSNVGTGGIREVSREKIR